MTLAVLTAATTCFAAPAPMTVKAGNFVDKAKADKFSDSKEEKKAFEELNRVRTSTEDNYYQKRDRSSGKIEKCEVPDLLPLEWDDELCEVARIRAAEEYKAMYFPGGPEGDELYNVDAFPGKYGIRNLVRVPVRGKLRNLDGKELVEAVKNDTAKIISSLDKQRGANLFSGDYTHVGIACFKGSSNITIWYFAFAAVGTEKNQGVKKEAREAMAGNELNNEAGLSLGNSFKTEANNTGESNVKEAAGSENESTKTTEGTANESNSVNTTETTGVAESQATEANGD